MITRFFIRDYDLFRNGGLKLMVKNEFYFAIQICRIETKWLKKTTGTIKEGNQQYGKYRTAILG